MMGGSLGAMEDMTWDKVDEEVNTSGVGILAPLQEHFTRIFIPFLLVTAILDFNQTKYFFSDFNLLFVGCTSAVDVSIV